jgi:hypothetical protein
MRLGKNKITLNNPALPGGRRSIHLALHEYVHRLCEVGHSNNIKIWRKRYYFIIPTRHFYAQM